MAGKTSTSPTDSIGLLAYVVATVASGLLILAFATAVMPAVRAQNLAPCRALSPEPRSMPAPDMNVTDLEGNVVNLSDFRGRFVVLNFWATWCGPCVREWPELDRLAQRLTTRDDVVVLAVSVDEDKSEIRSFLERAGLAETPVRVLSDTSGQIPVAFGTTKMPDTYFVDEAGQVVSVFINARQWGSPGAIRCIDSMVDNAG